MKKVYLGLSMIFVLGLAACQAEMVELPPLPTMAVSSGVTETPKATEAVMTTVAPEVSEEISLTQIPEPTKSPVPTASPESTENPTVSPRPTAMVKPTATSVPTATPKPTATEKPTVTPVPTSTPTPTAKPVSKEVERLLRNATEHNNTVINGTVCKSEEEANEYVRKMSLTYSYYSVVVENPAYLHTVAEYMELFPEILQMKMESIEIYRNGICMVFTDVETVRDANLCYTIRTGDASVLSDTEKEILAYLKEVIAITGADKLGTTEAVRALHDYLVLELQYDESFREMSHSPEGVMRNKTAVCDGYARTMRLLLLLRNIESEIVSGIAKNQPHAWNLVKMEDGWYHVDVTWDDPVPDVEGKVSYFYFLKNDTEMEETHIWTSDITCNGTKYEVYIYEDVLCDSYDRMRWVYDKQIWTEEYLVFCYPKNGSVTREMILDFVMSESGKSVSYYPEQELTNYLVLELANPFMGK